MEGANAGLEESVNIGVQRSPEAVPLPLCMCGPPHSVHADFRPELYMILFVSRQAGGFVCGQCVCRSGASGVGTQGCGTHPGTPKIQLAKSSICV